MSRSAERAPRGAIAQDVLYRLIPTVPAQLVSTLDGMYVVACDTAILLSKAGALTNPEGVE